MGVLNRIAGRTGREALSRISCSGGVPIRAVGALTSKPYAFTSRAWELKSVESVDVLDGVGSNVRVDTRGQEIMRVLPRLNEDVNEEWISDKTRFSYDGLKRQRLNTPMVRTATGELVPMSWEKVPLLLRNKLTAMERAHKDTGYEVQAIVGPYADLESITALRHMIYTWFPNGQIHVQEQPNGVSTDFRHNYMFNTTIAGIEISDVCLLIGCNPRKEAPILNARIRKGVIHNRMMVASIGCAARLTYPYRHLGTSVKTLQKIADGKHALNELLKQAARPSLIVSNKALQRVDGGVIFDLARRIADKYMVKEDWDGFNVLHTGANTVGALDVGFDDKFDGLRSIDGEMNPWANTKILYLMGADDLENVQVPDDCFIIYQGHHGDQGASMADLVLPGAAYTEKTVTYVNTEGRVQKSKLSFFPPGNARNDADIIRLLMGPIFHGAMGRQPSLSELAPHLTRTGSIQKADRIFEDGEKVDPSTLSAASASDVPLGPPIDNFYMTDPITRSSKVMAKCTQVMRESNFDF
mmetsp:Transcript_9051/g.27199  ORF Transcript_9051/g.27199 Transcript_9051/m.27199 type:complete len:526 (+) Transcript_9051:161-1738(+)